MHRLKLSPFQQAGLSPRGPLRCAFCFNKGGDSATETEQTDASTNIDSSTNASDNAIVIGAGGIYQNLDANVALQAMDSMLSAGADAAATSKAAVGAMGLINADFLKFAAGETAKSNDLALQTLDSMLAAGADAAATSQAAVGAMGLATEQALKFAALSDGKVSAATEKALSFADNASARQAATNLQTLDAMLAAGADAQATSRAAMGVTGAATEQALNFADRAGLRESTNASNAMVLAATLAAQNAGVTGRAFQSAETLAAGSNSLTGSLASLFTKATGENSAAVMKMQATRAEITPLMEKMTAAQKEALKTVMTKDADEKEVRAKAWSAAKLDELLSAVDYAGSNLEDWLRNGFFEQHCKLFHHRPFLWHIWDGRKDGFSALVNYHQFDHKLLEKLTYTYLGDWIKRQQEAVAHEESGADDRLLKAQQLQAKLKLILEGEAPYDIFVRWKPLEQQPVGWHPDLNDGVRLNIRPFMQADVLRKRPNIKWGVDRGKNPPGTPWGEVRDNDRHLRLEEKRGANR